MPEFHKLDYEMVAHVLNATPMTPDERQRLSDTIKTTFRRDNPAFDGARFDADVHEGTLFRPSGRMRTAGAPRWTRQHYVAVADMLNTSEVDFPARREAALRFTTIFGNDNPNFKVFQFLKAAGIGSLTEEQVAGELFARGTRAVQRRPGDIPVVSHVRRRPKSVVDRFGHRIRVREWPSSAGMATLRRHYKRSHPIAWRLSVMKGARTRRRRREEGQ